MYAFLREFLPGRPTAAPGHTGFHSHPSLEALEDRSVPAVTAVGPAPIDPTLSAPVTQAPLQNNTPPAATTPGTTPGTTTAGTTPGAGTPFTPAAAFSSPFSADPLIPGVLSQQNPLGLPQAGNPNGAQQTPSFLGQLSSLTVAAMLQLQLTQSAAGFQGRIVFPGTGLMVRSATEPGPMAQFPGLFLVGGNGGVVSGEGRTTSDATSPESRSASGGAALDSGDNNQDTRRVGTTGEEEDTTSSTTTSQDTDSADSTDGRAGEAWADRPIDRSTDGE